MSRWFPYYTWRRLIAQSASVFCFGLAILLSSSAYAARAESEQPIYVQADRWTYDDLKQVNVLTGRVIVTKGALTIKGDRVILKQDPKGYQSITSYAERQERAYFRQELNGARGYIEGYGKQIDYNSQSDLTVLTGYATVRRRLPNAQLLDEISGSMIRYDGRKEFYTASAGESVAGSGQEASRVRAILTPRSAVYDKALTLESYPTVPPSASSPLERNPSQ
ncbi:lipopolysaccharide transport periplasmic protein LptA [Mycoavidus sp. B2-EB]|uniref:lipopolysaccharide transport periplasmic protein LptA n=1 Tax=Mycoavidus sp. B2-EB TaxID=2651972 RepID=UPI0016232115|nr:lipopolysaccharide transport periplasmic protein LptA [Mycoavidus sp. B2-EB]BBO59357.1 lipopolysaccharide export system protein LptA [Mycoavidus sp. B2-EB]